MANKPENKQGLEPASTNKSRSKRVFGFRRPVKSPAPDIESFGQEPIIVEANKDNVAIWRKQPFGGRLLPVILLVAGVIALFMTVRSNQSSDKKQATTKPATVRHTKPKQSHPVVKKPVKGAKPKLSHKPAPKRAVTPIAKPKVETVTETVIVTVPAEPTPLPQAESRPKQTPTKPKPATVRHTKPKQSHPVVKQPVKMTKPKLKPSINLRLNQVSLRLNLAPSRLCWLRRDLSIRNQTSIRIYRPNRPNYVALKISVCQAIPVPQLNVGDKVCQVVRKPMLAVSRVCFDILRRNQVVKFAQIHQSAIKAKASTLPERQVGVWLRLSLPNDMCQTLSAQTISLRVYSANRPGYSLRKISPCKYQRIYRIKPGDRICQVVRWPMQALNVNGNTVCVTVKTSTDQLDLGQTKA